jgi:hypothetical protein
MLSFDFRLKQNAGLWPEVQSRLLNDYLKSSNVYLLRNSNTNRLKAIPYWASFPCWLHFKWKRDNSLGADYSLEDFLWAQFCVYLSIKISDDELDGQTGIASSGSLSKLLLKESELTLSNYFVKNTNFWKAFYDCIDETNSAIKRINELQFNWSCETDLLGKEYYLLSSVLKIGTLALFTVNNKQNEYDHAAEYLDEMSTGGQILDDLYDYKEDLLAGKLNYAARILLDDSQLNFPKESVIEKITESIIRTNRYKEVLNLVRAHYNIAHESAKRFGLGREDKYHNTEMSCLMKYEDKIHHDRVLSVLGNI